MKTRTHFLARKFRQYRFRAKHLRRAQSSSTPMLTPQQQKWARQLQNLYQELQSYYSRRTLRRMAAGAAVFLSLQAPSFAQDFVEPIQNPWQLESENFWPIQEFVDIDNDGDLDLFLSGYGPNEGYFHQKFYENIGIASSPLFIDFEMTPFGVSDLQVTNATFGDLDNDGDLDMLLGSYDQMTGVRYYENVGDAENPFFDNPQYNPFGIQDAVYFNFVHLTDLDDDGDLDLMLTQSQGILTYYENTGDANAPIFSNPTDFPFGLNTLPIGTYVRAFDLADLDGDGDQDMLIHEYDTSYDEGIFYLENVGDASNPNFAAAVEAPFNLSLNAYSAVHLNLADFDADGDIDLTAGVYDGSILYFKNLGDNVAPTSSDFSIITPFETAYEFTEADFPFSDANSDDDFDKISVETIPTGGILSVAGGGGLFGGEEIDAEDLFLLAYIPDAGGFGVGYDQFQFKVADADTFSDETYTVTITVQNPGSTQESLLDLGCRILQNPIREVLRVQLGDQPILTIQVVSALGSIVAEQTETKWIGGNIVELAAQEWPSGTYWLKIRGEEGTQIIPFVKH